MVPRNEPRNDDADAGYGQQGSTTGGIPGISNEGRTTPSPATVIPARATTLNMECPSDVTMEASLVLALRLRENLVSWLTSNYAAI